MESDVRRTAKAGENDDENEDRSRNGMEWKIGKGPGTYRPFGSTLTYYRRSEFSVWLGIDG